MILLWSVFGAMLLAAALIVCLPLYRGGGRRFSPAVISAALVVVVASALLYAAIGRPGVPSGPGATPSVDEMVAALAARLESSPEDTDGWKMLGRSYIQLQRYDEAVAAFERAVALENSGNAQTLADLAEAALLAGGEGMRGRPAELVEAALAAAPNNPKALFYGGIAAIERGDQALAADRWESLLALSPPPEIQEILRQRVSEWRGSGGTARAVAVELSIADEARSMLPGNATVFIIARDPSQPAPPVAVARRKLDELPATVTLSDADAMIPGRTLAQFPTLEIVARASASGEPLPQTGDWFGSAVTGGDSGDKVAIRIDAPVEAAPQ